jgi:membrane protease YdiL (CAAX protease family)
LPFVLLAAVESIFLAACVEELLMRGWRYSALRLRLAVSPTIIITTLLFAAGHVTISLANILTTVPLGLAAGYLRERTVSVRAPIPFHMLHNAIAVAVLLLKA